MMLKSQAIISQTRKQQGHPFCILRTSSLGKALGNSCLIIIILHMIILPEGEQRNILILESTSLFLASPRGLYYGLS